MKSSTFTKKARAIQDDKTLAGFSKAPVILQIIPRIKGGGVEAGTLEVAKEIIDSGGNAIVAAWIAPGQVKDMDYKIQFINLPLHTKNPWKIYSNINRLKELMENKKVDIVHARSRAPAWSAYFACKALNIPFITTYHATYSSSTFLKKLYNSIMVRGRHVIAISEFIQHHIIQSYGECSWFDQSKIRLIPRGIDMDFFNPDRTTESKAQKLKKSWGFSPDTKIILMPGRISQRKGHSLVIRALKDMKANDTAIMLLGSDKDHEKYKDSLLTLAASLGLQDRVKWSAHTDEMASAYKCASLVVSASMLPEGFGRTLAESQAMKKPIISADHGPARELIEEGVTGWLFPPNNPKELSRILDHALSLPKEELDRMGNKGRERIENKYTKTRMCGQTINLYRDILLEKKKTHETL